MELSVFLCVYLYMQGIFLIIGFLIYFTSMNVNFSLLLASYWGHFIKKLNCSRSSSLPNVKFSSFFLPNSFLRALQAFSLMRKLLLMWKVKLYLPGRGFIPTPVLPQPPVGWRRHCWCRNEVVVPGPAVPTPDLVIALLRPRLALGTTVSVTKGIYSLKTPHALPKYI